MRHTLYAIAVLCLVLVVPSAAKADTVFALQNVTFKSGAIATGTVSLDTTAGAFISANVTYQLGTFSTVFSGPFEDPGTVFGNQIFSYLFNANGDIFLLDLPVTWVMNYPGGPLCSDAYLCDDFRGYVQIGFDPADQFATGNLVPVSPVPEPSTLLLLSTALTASPILRRRGQTRRA